ncbi:MAG: nucleotide excision repair endonuclease [Peptostreptococcaceae bacterium]
MFYVYRLLDKHKDILYVGRTDNIHRRYNEHIKNKSKDDWKTLIVDMEYIEVECESDSMILEIYYISKYQPPYNVEYRNMGLPKIEIPFVSFKPYFDDVTVLFDREFNKRLYIFYNNVKSKKIEFTALTFIEHTQITREEWKSKHKFILINILKCIKNTGKYNFTFIDSVINDYFDKLSNKKMDSVNRTEFKL